MTKLVKASSGAGDLARLSSVSAHVRGILKDLLESPSASHGMRDRSCRAELGVWVARTGHGLLDLH